MQISSNYILIEPNDVKKILVQLHQRKLTDLTQGKNRRTGRRK